MELLHQPLKRKLNNATKKLLNGFNYFDQNYFKSLANTTALLLETVVVLVSMSTPYPRILHPWKILKVLVFMQATPQN